MAYEKIQSEYEESEKAAGKVSSHIDKVESVAQALFDEWRDELNLYQNAELRRLSKQQMETTKSQYSEMLASMHRAEKSMAPVLRVFHDNVLFMKHNLKFPQIIKLIIRADQ